jgi:hypothetical protein
LKHPYKITVVASFLGFLFLCVGVARAADTWGEESLRGLKPFQFLLAAGSCPMNLVKVLDMNRDIELKLRIARIPTDAKVPFPNLLMDVSCLRLKVGDMILGYAIHMRLSPR